VNAYELQEDGNYTKCEPAEGTEPFNIQERFFDVTETDVMQAHFTTTVFDEIIVPPVDDVPADMTEGADSTIATI
jgi:polyphosphate kinase